MTHEVSGDILLTKAHTIAHGARPGQATASHVHYCLRELQHVLEKGDVTSIALPQLATGVGGLDGNDVKPLVHAHLGGLPIPVFVHTEYHKGVQANEPGLS